MSINFKIAGLFLCLLSSISILNAQTTSEILVYDYSNNSLKAIETFEFDPAVKHAHTKHYCDAKEIAKLDQETPTDNLIDDTNFTNLVPLASLENELPYPYSTGVKIVLPDNNDKHQASGVMVGNRYVLTAGHSVLKKYTNQVLFKNIDVIAAYDHTLKNDMSLRSAVSKIYFVKDWRIGDGEDLVLLELEEPIGKKSGWMSIGFEEEEELTGDVYHKISYPAYNTPYNKKPYTGNDLHVSYGIADYVSPEFIGVENHIVGLGGESGSPIFTTNNKDEFITFGVLTFLGNYNHTRLRPSIYHAFASILEGNKTILPLKNEVLKSFKLSKLNQGRIMLVWDMTENDMFMEYDVSRSYDGDNFEYLETVDASELNMDNSYDYIDEKVMDGKVFYKLTGIDENDNSKFLDIKTIKIGKQSVFDISIYPNPATEYITIEAKKEIEEVDLMVVNSQGKLMSMEKLASKKTIDTSEFQKGIYHILVNNKEVKETFSFVVQ